MTNNSLLFIEPTADMKSKVLNNDIITQFVRDLWEAAEKTTTRGFHEVDAIFRVNTEGCLVKGMPESRTNGACVHYMLWYRNAIRLEDWKILSKIAEVCNRGDVQEQCDSIISQIESHRFAMTPNVPEYIQEVEDEINLLQGVPSLESKLPFFARSMGNKEETEGELIDPNDEAFGF